MSRKVLFLCVIVLAVIMVAAVQAQQQPGPGGRGGRGMGGFGMMGRGGGGSMMTLMLLNNEKVQKELEIVPEQKEKLDALRQEQRQAMPDFRGMRDLSEEERRAKMDEMRKKMEKQGEEMQAKIKEILLPNQLERLNQIRVQVLGSRAIMDAEVQKQLGITEEQKKKMTDLGQEMMGKFRDAQGDREKIQELLKESEKQVKDVLTADQKEKLEKMKGPAFEGAATLLGPGGPGGGRGGNRPPRRTN
jgi:hypothetical protein